MSDEDDCIIIEDNLNYKSISCENIPELFLDKLVAKKHFGRFGKINRFILRPKRLQCTVEYEREEDAENAFVNAGVYNGLHFDIKYTTNEVTHARNTEEWVDPDVQAELDAMGNSMRTQSRAPGLIRQMNIRVPKPILKVSRPMEGIARVDATARSELESILRKPAADIEDRYRILDARDKLIRLTTVRTTDIKKAVSIKGICPDMCPEKERLLREAKHQVSSFELEGASRNVMDHKIAIKEYSRSSADQETPLTHELRPEPVLNMTMSYLMHRIMDLCDHPEVNIGDWYHFVWDRTRSIRKDITQQELCSLGAVQLVEQCARFHIHCAARLIAEDASVFDQKINTENLTKCLQTLKYMYHDLRLKNIKCPNEAEFRAYVVLLNLSDANFLWEIKQLPHEIQNSPEIRSALSIYLAMENNNYVKFFNFVRKTTYLNACILLRYFTQVRLKAIMTIIKAYNSPRHMVSIPLKYFKEILAFESEEASIALFNYYGLDCDSEKVLLDRTAFYVPDMPFFMERSLNIVEAKRNVSVGEIVCGKKMDDPTIFENHIPHNSFDEEGYLRPEAWNAEDQIEGSPQKLSVSSEDSLFKVPKASPPISPKLQNKSLFQLKTNHEAESNSMQPPMKPPPPIFSLKPMTGFGPSTQTSTSASIDNIFAKPKEVVQTQVTSADTNLFSIPAFNKPSDIQTSIFGNTTKPLPTESNNKSHTNSFQSSQNTFKTDGVFQHFQEKLPDDTTDFIQQSFKRQSPEVDKEKQKKEEEEKQRQKKNEERIKKAQEEQIRLAELEKQRKTQEAEKRKKEESIRKKKIKQITIRSDVIFNEILDDVLNKEISLIVSEDLTKFKKIISESDRILNELIEECTIEHLAEVIEEESSILTNNQKVLQKFFHIWRNNVIMQKERRKLIECTPIWLMQESMEETVPQLAHPCQNETLQMMTRYRLGVPGNFNLTTPETKPIDVIALLLSEFRGRAQTNDRGILKSRRYLKMIISMPAETEELEGFHAYFNNWLEKNIVRNDTSNSNIFLRETKENVCLCIRKISGISGRNEKNIRVTTEYDHSDALLFVMTCSNMLDSRRRLHHLLKLSQIYKPIPLAIVVYNSSVGDDFIGSELELEKLIDDDKICSWRILGSYQRVRDEGLKNSLEDAFQYLGQNYSPSTELEMQQLPSFINGTLANEFWTRLNESWAINPSFRKLCTQPSRVVELYNECIDRLIAMLNEDLSQYPEFPSELREFVPQLQCDIPLDIEYFPENWKIEERTFRVKRFLKKIKLKQFSESPSEIDKLESGILQYSSSCISHDKHLAEKAGYSAIKNLLDSLNNPELFDLTIAEKMNFVSWLNILKPIALTSLTFTWSSECKYLPKEIIYKKSVFNDFISIPWWLENNTLKTIKMFPPMDEEDENIVDPPDRKRKRTEDSEPISLDDILAHGFAMVEKADKNIEKYRKFRNTSCQISKSFDSNLYKQEMAIRSAKRLIKENL